MPCDGEWKEGETYERDYGQIPKKEAKEAATNENGAIYYTNKGKR